MPALFLALLCHMLCQPRSTTRCCSVWASWCVPSLAAVAPPPQEKVTFAFEAAHVFCRHLMSTHLHKYEQAAAVIQVRPGRASTETTRLRMPGLLSWLMVVVWCGPWSVGGSGVQ